MANTQDAVPSNFLEALPQIIKKNGGNAKIDRYALRSICNAFGIKIPGDIKAQLQETAVGGMYNLHSVTGEDDGADAETAEVTAMVPEKTDEELLAIIANRYKALDFMAEGVIGGKFRSLIASGNPGMGKTFALEGALSHAETTGKIGKFTMVKGYVRASGLFTLLYQHRFKGDVIMLDDCDSVFSDSVGLNLLKAALDTGDKRQISWVTSKVFVDPDAGEDGADIPNSFEFEGAIVFVTNIDFERSTKSGSNLAAHLNALMSRSFYLDLNLGSQRELYLRMRSVVEAGSILPSKLSKAQKAQIMGYVENRLGKLRERSLRTVVKLGQVMEAFPDAFEAVADATLLSKGSN